MHVLCVLLCASNLLYLVQTDVSHLFEKFVDVSTMEEALAQMSGEVTREYFGDHHCVAVVTDIHNSNSREIYRHFPADSVPTMHISFPLEDKFANNVIQEEAHERPRFDKFSFVQLALASLDARCTGYLVQVPDLSFMVAAFAELTRWASQRVNRQFLFLPTVTGASDRWESDIKQVFSRRCMDFMPDLVVVRVVSEDSQKSVSETSGEGEHTRNTCNQEEIQDKPNACNNVENTYNGKVLNSADILNTSEKRHGEEIQQGDVNTEIQQGNVNTEIQQRDVNTEKKAIQYEFELITHKFKWPNPEEVISLDIWCSIDGFVEKQNLYPDKITNLMGKPFYITTVPYPPFAVLDIEVDPPINDGVEFRVVYEHVKKYNMTYKGVYDLENFWGSVWPNGSGNGLNGLVAEDKADIGFAAVYLWQDEYKFTDYR